MSKIVDRHRFIIDNSWGGSSSLTLETLFVDNEERPNANVFLNQKLTLDSYGNKCVLELYSGALTPTILRNLANEIEHAQSKAKIKLREEIELKKYETIS